MYTSLTKLAHIYTIAVQIEMKLYFDRHEIDPEMTFSQPKFIKDFILY